MAALTAVMLLASLLVPLAGIAHADHPPDAVDAEPETDSNTVGTTHEIEVTATEGDPPDNTTFTNFIRFVVTDGPNAGTNGQCPVQPGDDGDAGPTNICEYTSNGQAGTDTIRVFADLNGDNVHNPDEPFDDVEKEWTAGDPATISIAPTSASSATGNCNPFTVTVNDEFGNPVEGATVRVRQTHNNDAATVGWCEPSTGPNPVLADQTGTQPPGSHDAAADAGPTNDDGQVTFGITSDTTGTVTVQVWPAGSAGSSDTEPGAISASATKTWTGGGAGAVTTIEVDPASASNPTTTTHTFTLTARNAQGNPVGGVIVRARVESGPNTTTAMQCTTGTSAAGTPPVGTCEISYTSGSTGTDTWRFWVNQAAPPGQTATDGPDPHEPQVTASKTWTPPPVVGDIEVTCEGTAANVADDDCVNPVDDPTDTFTALVTDPDGNPMSGVRVDWEITTNTTPPSTLSATQCTTGADGTCSVTVTNPDPEHNDTVTVTATVAGTAESDSATKTWQARAPQISVAPLLDTNQTRTSHTVVATVADQFGDPFANQNVNFNVSGRNNIAPQARTTNAAGEASFTYNDTGGTAETAGNDTIFANHTGPAMPAAGVTQASKRWIPEPAVAAQVQVSLDSCADAKTANPQKTETDDAGNVETIWAWPTTAGGEELGGHEVTFTTNLGFFVGPAGQNLGQSTTATIGADGCADVDFSSEEAGDATITATIDGASDSAVKTWEPLGPRNITLDPDEDTNPPGTTHEITATVVDRFGNPVPGTTLSWTRAGAGFVVSAGESPTNAAGQARIVIRSDELGTTTVTAMITGHPTLTNECTFAVNVPTAGAPAGNCSFTAEKEWAEPEEPDITRGPCEGLNFGETAPNPDDPSGVGMIIAGTPGDDILDGTAGNDIICGLAGNDLIRGFQGADLLVGGPGNDDLRGGRGPDILRGNRGSDTLRGGPGRDSLFGGVGPDVLIGGPGADRLFGGPGRDRLFAGRRPGRNFLHGGRGFDRCRGRPNTIFHQSCNVQITT